MTKSVELLDSARDIAASVGAWADLSNALFDPANGLVTRAYPSRDERAAFVQTEEYRAIRQLIDEAKGRTGLVDGATPKKSGRFVVRLPRSLHAALEQESTEEGISLNQLVVTKLAVQMSRLTSGATPEMAKIAQAYLEVRRGYSTDRVVADPETNRAFLNRCREFGLTGTNFELNWKLFNGRKGNHFKDLPKTKIYTASRKDEFEFSSEIAARYVQEQAMLRNGSDVSLDRIICDPDLAAQFDAIAQKLAPGYSPLDYRWVAFGVRKASGRYAGKADAVDLPSFDFKSTQDIRASQIPMEQGVYWFRCEDDSLFIGDTDNLRNRVERHFDSGGGSGFPDWLYETRHRPVSLGLLPMPKVTPTNRKILELGAIKRYLPIFNYVGSRAA
jgi:site-specific DNA-methyltransferase (adenine-specific)